MNNWVYFLCLYLLYWPYRIGTTPMFAIALLSPTLHGKGFRAAEQVEYRAFCSHSQWFHAFMSTS